MFQGGVGEGGGGGGLRRPAMDAGVIYRYSFSVRKKEGPTVTYARKLRLHFWGRFSREPDEATKRI